MRKKVLITGGCGFVGSHIVEHFLRNTIWDIVVFDRLNYASSGFDRLRDINAYDDRRVKILTADFTQPIEDGLADEVGELEHIIHVGAETHVDNSIEDPYPFVMSNVLGTMRLLDFARKQPGLKRFVYFSTDEVFGPAPPGTFYREWDRYNSTNPYAATKAGGEELALAYANTFKVPVIVTHTMNVFGERQHFEKFIPGTIRKVMEGEEVTIHASSDLKTAGSRFYIHARNVASAILHLLDNSEVRDKYNIVGEKEVDNLEMARIIARVVGKPLKHKMVDFHSSRPGHDLRYALNGSKMHFIGWKIPVGFEASLEKTIKWFVECPRWLGYEPVI